MAFIWKSQIKIQLNPYVPEHILMIQGIGYKFKEQL